MPRLTIAASLLAALALVPARAVAGPPERPSGRTVLDEVSEGLRKYRSEKDQGKRIDWLKKLAPSRDPRVAVELWQVFAFASEKRSVAIRQVAKECLARYYVTQGERQLADSGLPDAEWGPCVCGWWSKHGADMRRRAALLPR
jgi:hypothetical protein